MDSRCVVGHAGGRQADRGARTTVSQVGELRTLRRESRSRDSASTSRRRRTLLDLRRRVTVQAKSGAWARYRFLTQTTLDTTAWVLALGFATLVRYDLSFARVRWHGVVLMIPVAAAAQMVTGT